MKHWLLVPLLLFIHAQGQTQTPDTERTLACIQQLIDDKVQARCGEPLAVPGILVAVKFGGEPVTAMAAGFSVPHCHNQQMLDPDMLFEIGSISKPVTAATLLKFSEQGLINIDDRVREWAPAMSFLPGINGSATLRQCMQHVSGINDYNQNVSNAQPVLRPPHLPPWTNPRIAAYASGILGPRHPNRFASGTFFWQPRDVLVTVQQSDIKPGTRWLYSDANYTLMGMVWQILANQGNLVRSLKRQIMEPSGLTALFLPAYQEVPHDRVATAWNKFDQVGPGQRLAYFSSSWVAGAMLSTTSDITTFMYELLGSRQIIGKPYLKEMKAFTDCKPGCYFPGDVPGIDWTDYGLGLMKMEVKRLREPHAPPILMWGHGGKTAGFNSMSAYLPESDATFTLTVNQGMDQPLTTWTDTVTLIRDIARLLAFDATCEVP